MRTRIKALNNTVRFIRQHPLGGSPGLLRFAKWQAANRLLTSSAVVFDWVDSTKLIIERGEHGATGNLYCGLHEYTEMALLLDVLRSEDLFLDVGANVGTYTILASGVCHARTVAFEPGELAFKRLSEHVALNRIGNRVEALQAGASSESGQMEFIADADTLNRIAHGEPLPGELRTTIDVFTVDEVLNGRTPAVMKIDVEGWERSVLAGASVTLKQPELFLCIVEVNDAIERYGYSTDDVYEVMKLNDFLPYSYEPKLRRLSEGIDNTANNVIFIRDLDAVLERIEVAPNRVVLGRAVRV